MNTSIKLMALLFAVSSQCAFPMEQTQENYMPPVYIRNIFNTTNYKLELEMENKFIATIAPNSSEHFYVELPLLKHPASFSNSSPSISVIDKKNKKVLSDWVFRRYIAISSTDAYVAQILEAGPAEVGRHQAAKVKNHFSTGQKDSYEIDITFGGKDLRDTEFDIIQTVR
jgi:hypothetical protein